MKISRSTARQLALARQGLDGGWGAAQGKEGVIQTVERLGYVQIDTISVVQRAHHHVLWSRCPDYQPQMLHELLACERRVFEWWTHAASYIPMRDYRYYLPRMRAAAERSQARQWIEAHRDVVRDVLDRIRAEGPLGSSDFAAPEGFKRGTWWSWKPAKRAMETLFSSGELMVSERRGFQRLYDLRERVLPAEVELTEPAPDQVARFTIRRALGGLGIAADGDVHWGRQRVREDVLQELVDAGEVGVGEDGGSVAVAVSGGVVGVAVGTAGPGVGERVGTVWR
ncbi:MAG: YcaQ family DNA glycosylase [Anaerolineae bacterium]|nr:YcaQ family DNA glycosylase [Anaerolineae bacterium]